MKMPCPSGGCVCTVTSPGCDNSLSPTRGIPRSPTLSPCHLGMQGATCAHHDAHKATRLWHRGHASLTPSPHLVLLQGVWDH